MKKESRLHRLLKKIGLIKTHELTEAERLEMCNRCISDGVCPGVCDICAWGRRADDAV